MHMHGMYFALCRPTIDVHDPDPRQLQIDYVAILKLHDLIGSSGQGQGVRRQKILVGTAAHHQWRTMAGPTDPLRFVAPEHGSGVVPHTPAGNLLPGHDKMAGTHMSDQESHNISFGM